MIFVCPVCGGKLKEINNSLICSENHCFDKAKSGYVNLLLGSKCGNHGDNRLMTEARKAFLAKGFYEPLREEICSAAEKYICKGGKILDCGCGEGYYTSEIARRLDSCEVCGFDISKLQVDAAAKKDKGAFYAVASSFDIPVCENSVDLITEIFSPFCLNEFTRILKNGGYMIMAIPLENHLFELKEAVYDEPYKNDVSDFKINGFTLAENREVKYRFTLDNNEDIENLFMMTPYYYKTGVREQARLKALQSMTISAEFSVLIYKKIEADIET